MTKTTEPVRFPEAGWLGSLLGRQISSLAAKAKQVRGKTLRERLDAVRAAEKAGKAKT